MKIIFPFSTSHACVHLQGSNLTVKNKILAKTDTSANEEGALKIVAHNAKVTASFAFERNIVYTGTGVPAFSNTPLAQPYALSDGNVYWELGRGSSVLFPGNLTLHDWQRVRGENAHSVVADPQLDSNFSSGRVRPGSPRLLLSFVNIDTSTVGPRRWIELCGCVEDGR